MGLFLGLLLASALASADPAAADAPTTLEAALASARRNNAQLPVAALDRRIAGQRLREARARRRVALSADGELWLAPAGGYDPTVTDLGDERLQVVAETTLWDGGALRSQARQAEAEARGAGARYRQALAELDRQVREAFAGVLAGERETEIHDAASGRLRRYVSWLEDRGRGGQPVTADLLNARVRLATELAARSEAAGRAAERRAELAVLMGLPPRTSLALAPLPPPAPPGEGATPPEAAPATPGSLPDLAAARRRAEAATAELAAARAERSPQVTLRADAGLWGADPLHAVPHDDAASHPGADLLDRLRRDLGYSLSVNVHLPLLDTGGVAERIAQAELRVEQARAEVAEAEVRAGLEREQARRERESAYERYRVLAEALPAARDAYLNAESRYRGGSAGYLEVLDAFATSVETAVQQAEAELAYREADARRLRWGGTP